MFAFAPITRLVDWWTTDPLYRELFRQRPSSIGQDCVALLRKEIENGAREWGKNNSGRDVEKYRDGNPGNGSWCASLQYWAEKTVRAARGIKMPFPYTPGARKMFRLATQHGMRVDLADIQVGDLVLWSRGDEGSWKAHIGRVSRVVRDDAGKVLRWMYIAGNEGKYPAPVRERWGHKKKRRVGFARVG